MTRLRAASKSTASTTAFRFCAGRFLSREVGLRRPRLGARRWTLNPSLLTASCVASVTIKSAPEKSSSGERPSKKRRALKGATPIHLFRRRSIGREGAGWSVPVSYSSRLQLSRVVSARRRIETRSKAHAKQGIGPVPALCAAAAVSVFRSCCRPLP